MNDKFLNDGVYPPAVDLNPVIGKARFFLGDRWIEIGEFGMRHVWVPNQGFATSVTMPNVGAFFEAREGLDDGTKDWCLWGPRVN